MSWIRLILGCEEAAAEPLSDQLSECGALAVTVAPQDNDDADHPVFGEPGMVGFGVWPHCQIEVLLPIDCDIEGFISEVSAHTKNPFHVQSHDIVEDQDWVRLTQSQFDPIQVTSGLWVVPTWHEPPDPQAINLRIDPGQAFGTGSHPTTQLCLQWLARQQPLRGTILDYGCGSGILTLAAHLLGALDPVGVDLDPLAVQTASDNAHLNHLDVHFFEPDGLPTGLTYDGVIANILTNPLILLAPLLLGRLRSGGWLTLSGILETQVARVQAAYAPHCHLTVVAQQEGWVCLHGLKQVY